MRSIQRGLTIIELLITIAILAITLAMGIPAFAESRTRAEVRAGASDIVAALRWARSEAMRTNQMAVVRLGSGALCADGTVAAWAVTVGAQVTRCASGADFAARYTKIAALPIQSVSFTARGLVNAAIPAYQVSAVTGSAIRTITVEISGRINEAG